MCACLATNYPGGTVGIFPGIIGIALLGFSLCALFAGGVFPLVIRSLQRRPFLVAAKAFAFAAMALLLASCLWTFFETVQLKDLRNAIDATVDLWFAAMAALVIWVGCVFFLRRSKSS